MNTHAAKIPKNQSQSAANAVSQKQSGGESTFQFVDNRPEAVAQRHLQEMANNSPHVKQLRAFQGMANSSPQAKQGIPIQSMDDNYSDNYSATQKRSNNKENKPRPGKEHTAFPEKPVVQRIIVLDETELEWQFFSQARALKLVYQNEAITTLQKSDLSQMAQSESLRLLAHGHEQGRFAGRSAEDLKDLLVSHGLKLDIGEIELMSCGSGIGGDTSYVAQLARQLDELYTVTGFTGIAAGYPAGFGPKTGTTIAFTPTEEDVRDYKRIVGGYKTAITQAEEIAASARNAIGMPGADVEQIVLEAGESIDHLTAELNQELVQLNENILLRAAATKYVHNTKIPRQAILILSQIRAAERLLASSGALEQRSRSVLERARTLTLKVQDAMLELAETGDFKQQVQRMLSGQSQEEVGEAIAHYGELEKLLSSTNVTASAALDNLHEVQVLLRGLSDLIHQLEIQFQQALNVD